MAQPGSAFNAASKDRCEARYQNECWKSIARSKAAAASGVQDVSKWTLPKVSMAGWASTGWPMEMPAAARAEDSIPSDFMVALRRIRPDQQLIGPPSRTLGRKPGVP